MTVSFEVLQTNWQETRKDSSLLRGMKCNEEGRNQERGKCACLSAASSNIILVIKIFAQIIVDGKKEGEKGRKGMME